MRHQYADDGGCSHPCFHVPAPDERGFVALLFVIMMAVSLSAFVFTLTQSFSYTLTLLDSYRLRDNARSAALHCYFELVRSYGLDVEIVPDIGRWTSAPRGTSCMYSSFAALPNAEGFAVKVFGRSSDLPNGEVFSIEREFRKIL